MSPLASPTHLTRRRLLQSGVTLGAAAVVGCGDDGPGTQAGAGFPRTVKHALGTVTIPARPRRVVAFSVPDADIAVATGAEMVGVVAVEPTTDGLTPWLRTALDGKRPQLIDYAQPSFERIAALRPDLILTGAAFRAKELYPRLSQLAPTIAFQTKALEDPWPVHAALAGRALGREEEATAAVDRVNRLIARIRAQHPEFQGKTYAGGYNYAPGKITMVTSAEDASSKLHEQLGLRIAPQIAALGGVSGEVSLERLDILDADVVALGYANDRLRRQLAAEPLYRRLAAVRRDAVIAVDFPLATAGRNPSVLSIPYALSRYVPEYARILG